MDANTLEFAREGDKRAFADLVQAHYRAVYGVAFSAVGNWSAAEDIAQETFLVAWKNLPALRKPVAFGVWLRKIARNLSRNWLRSLSYRRQLETRQRELASAEASSRQDVHQQAERKEQRAQIWDALRSLSPRLREVVVLYYLEGRSVREVAQSLDCSPSAVKKRLERARPKLRAYFEARWEAELENERKRLQPPDAAKRFTAGLALGPVQAALGSAASGSGLISLWGHGLMHGELPSLIQSSVAGGLKLTGVKLAVSGACALLIGAVVLSFIHQPAPSGSDDTAPALVAWDAGDRPPTEAQTAALEPMPPQEKTSARQSVPTAAGVALAPPSAGAPVAPVEVRETIRITGHVFDEYGTPLPKATVTVMTGLPPAPKPTMVSSRNMARPPVTYNPPLKLVKGCAWLIEEGIADARSYIATCGTNGVFAVEATSADGRAVVAAWAAGCAPKAVSLELVPGEGTDDVSIALAPCLTLTGSVLNAQGRPVADATVRPTSWTWSGVNAAGAMGGMMASPVSCATDGHGRFTLPVARPGTLAVCVESPDEGEAVFTDLVVETDASTTLKYPVPAAVYGRILQSDSTPAEGCEVILSRTNTPVSHMSEGARSGGGAAGFGCAGGFGGAGGVVSSFRDKTYAAKVSADGTYRIERLDPNQAYVAAVTDERGACCVQGVPLGALRPGHTLAWNYTLQPPILIRGTVCDASTREPLAAVNVRCAKEGEAMSYRLMQPEITATDADGSYELRVVTGPGPYEIGPVFERFGARYAPVPEDEFAHALELEAKGAVELDLLLPAPHTRSFLVVDEDGQPAPGCAVDVREITDGSTSSWRYPEVTDADGRVTLSGLAPGVLLHCGFLLEAKGSSGESLQYEAEPGEVVEEETVALSAEDPRG